MYRMIRLGRPKSHSDEATTPHGSEQRCKADAVCSSPEAGKGRMPESQGTARRSALLLKSNWGLGLLANSRSPIVEGRWRTIGPAQ